LTSHSVNVIGNFGNLRLKSFSLSDSKNQLSGLDVSEGEALDDLPMVEDALGEGLSLGVSSEHASETERFRDRKECFDLNKRNGTKLRGVPVI